LLEAKASPQLAHGQWLPWLRTYCPNIPERTAQLCMQCAIHAEALKAATRCGFDSIRGALDFLKKKNREASVALMIERRELRELELAEATEAASEALGKKLYGVIYADCPWLYHNKPMGDVARAVEEHYPTMPLDDIKALKIPAARNCALFSWATVPMMPEAIEVMNAWGLTYKSMITWVKDKWGIGYWVRSQCEHLLIGTRGNIPAPAPGDQLPAFIEAPRRGHSEKPDVFAQEIAKLFPNVRKVEMFARKARPGWDVWGNEVNQPTRQNQNQETEQNSVEPPTTPVAQRAKTEVVEPKRQKARGRIAKLKAKRSGATTRMPATGKAALAAKGGQVGRAMSKKTARERLPNDLLTGGSK
jgi:N6-adenosine-specific RNA methylase IME4